jgi:septal ring-binding cell division protein DamX
MILAAVVAADRSHVARQNTDVPTLPPTAQTAQAVPAPRPDHEAAPTAAASNHAPARTDATSTAQSRSTDRASDSPPAKPAITHTTPPAGPPEPLANAPPTEADRPIRVIDPAAPESAPIAERVRYSIQLISFRKASSMAPFARRERLLDQARTLDMDADRSSWHPVLIGDFESRDDAEAALARLPDRLRDLKPIIRDIASEERLAPLR